MKAFDEFGLVNQILLALTAIGLIAVILRGYRMWWLRRPTRARVVRFGPLAKRGALRRMPPWAAVTAVVIAVILGWYLPLFGITLAAFVAVDVALGLRHHHRSRGTALESASLPTREERTEPSSAAAHAGERARSSTGCEFTRWTGQVMIADTSLGVITTALFMFAAGYCLYRIACAARWTVRIDHGFHLAMCASMIAMAWPWGLGVPLIPQGVLFTVAAVWFAVSAVRATPSTTAVDEHSHGPAMGAYHVFMMAAMVWMVAVMAGWVPGTSAHDQTADGSAGDMSGMGAHAHTPDMDMSSNDQTAAMSGPEWISVVSLTLTVAFAIAAIVLLYRLFADEQAAALAPGQPSPEAPLTSHPGNTAVAALPTSRLQSVAAACEVAMAAGMAIMMGVM